jgi:alanyl-tRNA synthetase
MTRTAREIRRIFLDFFEEKGHVIVPSAPIVVKDDPTLMFTNAGMNPFKDYFLGNKTATHRRIADTQKCLRVSGKHNDLEEVGRDGYHHTMFEMLGNWSFGDYFKQDAIAWAWELLTERLQLSPDIIYASYFGGDKTDSLEPDEESKKIWAQFLPPDHILPYGKKDNFWEMGDTGPCGPCSEIHVDLRSPEERKKIPGHQLVNADDPNVMEIWNLVFIQFNRNADGSLKGLPSKHVDTGMGFERLVRVLQKKDSNYDTDIFSPLIHFIEQATGITYTHDYTGIAMPDVAMRVIADHVRAVSFGIADGQMPSNTGAGYVLRRILRRAVRYYYTFLQVKEPLMYRLVPLLTEFFGDLFPGFSEQKDFVQKVIEQEEISFLRTLEGGIKRFETLKVKNKIIAGQDVFELYDTYGFPADLTRLMAAEKGWQVDEVGFEKALQQQKQRSRSDAAKVVGDWITVQASTAQPVFDGYDQDILEGGKLIKYRSMEDRDGHFFQLVLDRTSFYPEGGGQVGDKGKLVFGGEEVEVLDMIKENDLPIHITNTLPRDQNSPVTTHIDIDRRRLIENNHSATHLLHAALREILGDHVQQRGSLLDDHYLRFDFSHFAKVTPEELRKIEDLVNEKIRQDIQKKEDRGIPIKTAEQAGARMLFGEKYGERVRMITFDPAYSIELCGGCHVPSTGRIGFFVITAETAVAAGIRRIEALTAKAAEKYVHDQFQLLAAVRNELKNPTDIVKAIRDLQAENKQLRGQLEEVEVHKAAGLKKDLLQSMQVINGVRMISAVVDVPDQKLLKTLIYQVGQELGGDAFVLLGSNTDNKPQLMLYISEGLVKDRKLHAGQIIKELARLIQGGGGGQPFFASAGGTAPEGLNTAIQSAKGYIEN